MVAFVAPLAYWGYAILVAGGAAITWESFRRRVPGGGLPVDPPVLPGTRRPGEGLIIPVAELPPSMQPEEEPPNGDRPRNSELRERFKFFVDTEVREKRRCDGSQEQ